MPSVIGLLEQREARAREELESWMEVLSQAQEEVAAATERAERARVAREERVQALAEVGAGGVAAVPVDAGTEVGPGPVRVEPGYNERPPQWHPGLGEEALCGLYREVFRVVAAAGDPLSGAELTHRLGRPAEKNEVEKVRHRAYTLEARGWLVRENGLFRPAPQTTDGPVAPASVERPRPGGGSA
ncbi:hypothetical protein ACWEKM_08875 [Streptomyces sp. NPDC004752]